MVATVISAPPRTGKSLYTMQILEQEVIKNPQRIIYTNIIGCKLPGVLPAISTPDNPFDWRTLPNGALYVHDEAHEHPAFCKNDLLKDRDLISRAPYDEFIRQINDYENLKPFEKLKLLSVLKVINQYPVMPEILKVKEKESLVRVVKDAFNENNQKRKDDILDIGRSLTMHGHFGIDIYFITQRPTLLNEHVRASISEHLILRRLFKMKFAIIYTYVELQENFGMMTRKNAITTRFWRYPEHLYKYYVSAEAHPKSNFPKLWYAVAALPLFLMAGGYKYTMDYFSPNEKDTPISNTVSSSTSGGNIQADTKAMDLTIECREAKNLDKKECKEYLQKLTEQGLSIAPVNVYDGSKPYDVKYHPPEFQPKDFPRFKNAIVYSGKCTAYSQQGTIMHDVTSNDCFRLANGDRPFDYFAEEKRNVQPTYARSDDAYKKAYSENLARIDAERHAKAQDATVSIEQIPLGTQPPQDISGANSL